MTAYRAALASEPAATQGLPIGARRNPAGSITTVLAGYYRYNSWCDLAEETRTSRRRLLEKFKSLFGDLPITHVKRAHIEKLIGAGGANAQILWLKALRPMFKYAVGSGSLADDPTKDIDRAKIITTGGYHSWTDEEIAQYEAPSRHRSARGDDPGAPCRAAPGRRIAASTVCARRSVAG
jgi:hypothetical protein